MAEESTLQGLDIVSPTDPSGTDTSDLDMLDTNLHADLEAQLQMWTNMEFSAEDAPFFSAERDTASRSRHKNVNGDHFGTKSSGKQQQQQLFVPENTAQIDLSASLGFFGAVGAAAAASSNANTAGTHNSLNDLFSSWGGIFHASAGTSHAQAGNDIFSSLPSAGPVDPFISSNPMSFSPSPASSHIGLGAFPSSSTPTSAGVHIALNPDGHHPLTIRDNSAAYRAKLAATGNLGGLGNLGFGSIDPSTTTLGGDPGGDAPAPKRQRRGGGGIVDHGEDGPHPASNHSRTKSLPSTSGSNSGGVGKASKALTINTHTEHPSQADADDNDMDADGMGFTHGGPYSAAEDKRRRNTLASARFRLKKKEREAAMEKKAKELEEKVGELERECESLRKENGWLKGLVVGATNGEPISTSQLPTLTFNSAIHTAVNSVANTAVPSLANSVANSASNSVNTSPAIPIGPNPAGGNVIDIDHLLRVLQATGTVVISSHPAPQQQQPPQSLDQQVQAIHQQQQQQQPPSEPAHPPVEKATGKRKRRNGN